MLAEIAILELSFYAFEGGERFFLLGIEREGVDEDDQDAGGRECAPDHAAHVEHVPYVSVGMQISIAHSGHSDNGEP